MQTNLAQLDGVLKSPTGENTSFGAGDGVKSENPEQVESLRHYRRNANPRTKGTPKPTVNDASEIDIRLQILQQAIRDFAAVADSSSVQIAALPSKQSTAIVLVGVGYCRECGSLYNGFDEGCTACGTTVTASSGG